MTDILLSTILAGVLMARWRTTAGGRGEVSGASCAAHVSRLAAASLARAGAPRHCFRVLEALLPYWKDKANSMYFCYELLITTSHNINFLQCLLYSL